MRRPSKFKKTDVTRAAKAVLAAGVDIARVEIEPITGKISIMANRIELAQVRAFWFDHAEARDHRNRRHLRSDQAARDSRTKASRRDRGEYSRQGLTGADPSKGGWSALCTCRGFASTGGRQSAWRKDHRRLPCRGAEALNFFLLAVVHSLIGSTTRSARLIWRRRRP